MLNEEQAPDAIVPDATVPDAPEMDVADLIGSEPEGVLVTEADSARRDLKSLVEAIIYVTEEPVTVEQLAKALEQPAEQIEQTITELIADYQDSARGLLIREVAGGYKMGTKPEHHESLKAFAKSLKPPVKLSLAALETLAVIAYKQPVTGPEIMEIRGVQGAGVLKTLLDRKLIITAGRKQVVGKPMMYKTSKEFLLQFGLKDLAELPTLKEFEELRRLALDDSPPAEVEGPSAPDEAKPESESQPEPESTQAADA